MLLSPELAQPIVERAMATIQRNINMMDANGVIVGSGDPSRIGNFHQAAAAVLRTGRRVEIQPEDAPNWHGVRMGVNLPLRLDGRIVGVVGITGLPDEVRPFGELIREMVQLMLVQVRTAELERAMAMAREACLRDLLTGSGELSRRLIREATLNGLTEDGAFTVVLCEPAEAGDWSWVETAGAAADRLALAAAVQPLLMTGPWEGRLVLVCGTIPAEFAGALQAELTPGTAVAVGLSANGLAGLRRSYRTAALALDAGRRLHGPGAYTADRLHLETLLATITPDDATAFIERIVGGLPDRTSRHGRIARESVTAFVTAGMSLAEAAELLQVHRHTLVYRLDQVAAACGQDPREWESALRFYLAFLLEQLLGRNVES
jgi:carbohydrate diacid regulator